MGPTLTIRSRSGRHHDCRCPGPARCDARSRAACRS